MISYHINISLISTFIYICSNQLQNAVCVYLLINVLSNSVYNRTTFDVKPEIFECTFYQIMNGVQKVSTDIINPTDVLCVTYYSIVQNPFTVASHRKLIQLQYNSDWDFAMMTDFNYFVESDSSLCGLFYNLQILRLLFVYISQSISCML